MVFQAMKERSEGLHMAQLFLTALVHSKQQTGDGPIAMAIFIGATVN